MQMPTFAVVPAPHDEPLVSKTVVTLNYFESFKGIFLNYKKEAFIRAYSFSVFRNNANIKALAGNSGLVTISTYHCLSLPKFWWWFHIWRSRLDRTGVCCWPSWCLASLTGDIWRRRARRWRPERRPLSALRSFGRSRCSMRETRWANALQRHVEGRQGTGDSYCYFVKVNYVRRADDESTEWRQMAWVTRGSWW